MTRRIKVIEEHLEYNTIKLKEARKRQDKQNYKYRKRKKGE